MTTRTGSEWRAGVSIMALTCCLSACGGTNPTSSVDTVPSTTPSVGAIPSAAVLVARASAQAHPRTVDVAALKSGIDWEGRWTAAQTMVTLQYTETPTTEPLTGTVAQVTALTNTELDKTLLAAALWLRTGSPAAVAEAKRRAVNLASWSPTGLTSYLNNDQTGRNIVTTLALAYDWLYGQWTPTEQTLLLAAIRPRAVEILGTGPYGLNHGLSLDSWPYNSHGAVTTSEMAVACTVLAGIDPFYDQCVTDLVPRYLARPVPWGVDDGGYANGTNYAQWDMQWVHLPNWARLKQALGVDLWQTPWAQNYGKFIAYFLPPGAPTGLFGDGAEATWSGVWATQGKTYDGYLSSPLADWYARAQSGEQKYHLALLLAPQRDMSGVSPALPAGTAQGIHLPSIGWVAMHSDLGNPLRTSVYVKSSWYGSYNHSHADQNSFVLHAGGQVLAADSGYYDSYGSPHWIGWYKATRAHNAITFDGGQGQVHDTMTAKGNITQFGTTPVYDLVTGDATVAYGGALTQAVRSMVYLRPNTLVVYDALASATPRTWEWNIHALGTMSKTDDQHVEIDQGGVRLCVRMVDGPGVTFTQTDLFTPPPSGTYVNQWHGTFASLVKSNTAVFVTVLEVGCGNTPVTVAGAGETRAVTVLGNTFTFNGITVLKN